MKRKRRVRQLLLWLAVAYVSAYVLNSVCGGYRLMFVSSINHPHGDEEDGESRADSGAIVWQPRHGSFTRMSSDGLGKVFLPLIAMDQTFWHRDIPASAIESRTWFVERVSIHDVHLDDRELYIRAVGLPEEAWTGRVDHRL